MVPGRPTGRRGYGGVPALRLASASIAIGFIGRQPEWVFGLLDGGPGFDETRRAILVTLPAREAPFLDGSGFLRLDFTSLPLPSAVWHIPSVQDGTGISVTLLAEEVPCPKG